MAPPLVLLGSGYTLTRLARTYEGRTLVAATRDPSRRAELERGGARVCSVEEALQHVEGAHVVSSIPPEAGLDGRLAEVLARHPPSRFVYLSSTGVYGGTRGVVDETTPVASSTPAIQERLEAEARFRPLGAMVLRIAGIYGPGRGMHTRLLSGTHRLPEGGGGRLSRVHVEDLVEAIRVVLERGEPGGLYCVADDRAATQAETASWLCERLALPLPPTVPLATLHETLRGDRAVSNARLKVLGWAPKYPDFTTGFAAVLEAEGLVRPRTGDPAS
ncbi:NAD-dependent epimerase/dehydratase family protein [Stigmatella sp. ncwal1]|uniref:NAD-dependent epimerase/dehydratase family protein n=1 Tax=Stigmatella ashevillensis TaxID=2995309 RepID=A0ABT5D2R5_9BACT|nr:NAD-dependent epimerase/dehydratase family protein [Stigmatella ashevillena]MDC0707390.1 NAD-dependent epimerase/dehydratase family protein [Stigmatella ashevillena]